MTQVQKELKLNWALNESDYGSVFWNAPVLGKYINTKVMLGIVIFLLFVFSYFALDKLTRGIFPLFEFLYIMFVLLLVLQTWRRYKVIKRYTIGSEISLSISADDIIYVNEARGMKVTIKQQEEHKLIISGGNVYIYGIGARINIPGHRLSQETREALRQF